MEKIIDHRIVAIFLAASKAPIYYTGDKDTVEDLRARLNGGRVLMRKIGHPDADRAKLVKVCRPKQVAGSESEWTLRLIPRTLDALDELVRALPKSEQPQGAQDNFAAAFAEAAEEEQGRTGEELLEDFLTSP